MKRLPLRLSFVGAIVAGVFGLQLANNNLQNSYQDMLLQAGVAISLAVSLNIVNGFTGQFSIGHAGFMAVGAYAGGAMSYPLWVAGKKAIAAGHPTWADDPDLSSFFSSHLWLLSATTLLLGAPVA